MYCNYLQFNNACITLTAMFLKINLLFNSADTSTTFQKQVSISKWVPLMLNCVIIDLNFVPSSFGGTEQCEFIF